MKISILIFSWMMVSSIAIAQSDSTAFSKNKIIYFNNFLAGGLFGESGQGNGLTISTTHGVRINRLALGAGVGFDSYYHWKAAPVFGTVSFDVAKIKRNALFLQLNAGYAHAERIRREEWLTDYNEYGKEMISSMLGYRIHAEKFSLYLVAGHKFQKTNFSYNMAPWGSFAPPSMLYVEENINRLVIQIGFGLH
jgi:hypothetical protein